jgi:hypothetical protein
MSRGGSEMTMAAEDVRLKRPKWPELEGRTPLDGGDIEPNKVPTSFT